MGVLKSKHRFFAESVERNIMEVKVCITKGALLFHEILHSFIPQRSIQRTRKLMTVAQEVSRLAEGGIPSTSGPFYDFLVFNSIRLVPIYSDNFDSYYGYCSRDPDLIKELFDELKLGNVDEAKELLFIKGVCPNVKESETRVSPLMVAARKGLGEITLDLLALGAFVNSRDVNSNTALIYAASDGHKDIALTLIQAGANLNFKYLTDNCSNTVLTCAVQKEFKDITLALIKAGADLDLYNQVGDTALILATKKWDIDTAKSLLEAGADPKIKNKDRHTAYGIAKNTYGKNSDIAKLIKKYL